MKGQVSELYYDQYTQTFEEGSQSYEIPKRMLYLNIDENASSVERIALINNLIQNSGEENIYVFDTIDFEQDIDVNLSIIRIFNIVISVILFIIALF